MTGEEFAYAGNFLVSFGLLIVLIVIAISVGNLLQRRKSQDYRKMITDMYVASKTRFLAKEDNLDLVEEEKNFKIWAKKERIRQSEMDLDRTIEEELKERVAEPIVKTKKVEEKKK